MHKPALLFASGIICLCFSSSSSYGRDDANNADDQGATYTLPTLVFKHTKSAQTDNVDRYQALPFKEGGVDYQVKKDLIVNSASQSVSESINNLSGVQNYNQTGANPLFFIRGQRANITINGIPINQFDSSAQNLNFIPFKAIQSVSISPVGNSVLYGSMGIGGQINVETNDKVINEVTISPTYPVYGNDYLALGTELGENWKVLVNQQGQFTNGYRDFSQTIANTASIDLIRNTQNDKTKFFFNESTQLLEFPGALSEQQASQDPWQASATGKENFNSQSIFTGIQNYHDFNEQVSTHSFITYQQLWSEGNFPDIQNSDFTQNYNQLQLKPIVKLKNSLFDRYDLTTQLGVDGNFQNFEQSDTISQSNQNSYGVFVIPSFAVSDQLTVGVGGRYDYITTEGQFTNNDQSSSDIYHVYAYQAHLDQQWDKHYSTGLRVSRDYQLPFIDQSSLTPSPTSTFGLQPQTSVSYSISQDVSYDRWNLGANLYYMDIDNQIIFDSQAGEGAFAGENINLPPTQSVGLIISGDVQPIKSLNAGASITLSRNTFKDGSVIPGIGDVSGNRIPGTPDILGEAHSNWQFLEGFNWYMQTLYTGSMFADGDFENSLGKVAGYFVFNTAISYKISNWIVNFRVNNIFNKRYNVFTTTFNGDDLFVYPADGTNGAIMITYEF